MCEKRIVDNSLAIYQRLKREKMDFLMYRLEILLAQITILEL